MADNAGPVNTEPVNTEPVSTEPVSTGPVSTGLTGPPEPVAMHSRPEDRPIVCVHVSEVSPDRRRGGEVRTLLSPRNAGCVSGFSGVAFLQPGERITEHYHPYSEEFLFVADGNATADLDGEPHELVTGAALLIPPGTRHRVRNTGTVPVRIVFHLGPLAPRPELGHVDTEKPDGTASPDAASPDGTANSAQARRP